MALAWARRLAVRPMPHPLMCRPAAVQRTRGLGWCGRHQGECCVLCGSRMQASAKDDIAQGGTAAKVLVLVLLLNDNLSAWLTCQLLLLAPHMCAHIRVAWQVPAAAEACHEPVRDASL